MPRAALNLSFFFLQFLTTLAVSFGFRTGIGNKRVPHSLASRLRSSTVCMVSNSDVGVEKVLVFGATGRVGLELCGTFSRSFRDNVECHAFVRNLESAKRGLGEHVRLHQGDMENLSSIQDALVNSRTSNNVYYPTCLR